MDGYRYFLIETSLGWHKVLPELRVVLLCPTTVRAQTLWAAWHFAFYMRMGPGDRQPSERHRRFAWRWLKMHGVPLASADREQDACPN